MRINGFWIRALAYIIDIIPIVIILSTIFYFFFGFNVAIENRFNNTHDMNGRIEFLVIRNRIRDLSFLVYVLYGIIMDASKLQGTFGKLITGSKVVDLEGNKLTLKRSIARNLSKIISYLPLALGFIWVAFSKTKQGWHDKLAKTYVIRRG